MSLQPGRRPPVASRHARSARAVGPTRSWRGARAMLLACTALALGQPLRAQPPNKTVPAADAPRETEVPCSVLRSVAHGVIILGVRERSAGGPPCGIMNEYGAWLGRSDSLLIGRRAQRERDQRRVTGREWDFASGAMRVGAPTFFVLVRGDSLGPARRGHPRRLHLTAFTADETSPPVLAGSWYVLVDEDSNAVRMFRSAVAERSLHVALRNRSGTVLTTPGVSIDSRRVLEQLAKAQALRTALGFGDRLPAAQFIVGPPRDTTLAMLGVGTRRRSLFAMMVYPPLIVFAPLSAERGLDAHELVHVATFGRRTVVPGPVGEAYAMHVGGSHGRSFDEAFCRSTLFDSLPPLSAAQVDSATRGQWWNDLRADASGFVLGHAIGWFIAQRGDSAWIFADGPPTADNDALGFLSRRSGIALEAALDQIATTLSARQAECARQEPSPPPVVPPSRNSPVSPPSAGAGAPAPRPAPP